MGQFISAAGFVWRTYLILEWCKSGLAQLKSVYRLYKEYNKTYWKVSLDL